MVRGISETESTGFYRGAYPNGLRLSASENPAVLAAGLIRDIPQEISQRTDLLGMTQRLRTMIRWTQFANAFAGDMASIGEKQFYYVLSGNSYTFGQLQDRFYKTEEIISCEEAVPYMSKFLTACGNYQKRPGSYFDVSFPTFYVLGPSQNIRIGEHKGNPVIFPGIDVPAGDISFIKAYQDNLVYWNFGVLDRSGAILGRYAYDTKEPSFFSPYDYSVEEARLFMKFNRGWFIDGAESNLASQVAQNSGSFIDPGWLAGEAKGFVESVKEYIMGYQRFVYGKRNAPHIPQIELAMNGPARTPAFRVPNLDVETRGLEPDLIFGIYRMNLYPDEKYTIRTSAAGFMGKEVMVIEVKQKTGKKSEEARRYYFDWEQKAFIPHPPGQEVKFMGKPGSVSVTAKIKIPKYLLWRQWDDHPNRLIF